MSDIFQSTVERLSRVGGVRGALIVEADAGVPVTAELEEGVSGTAIAALAASLYRRTGMATGSAGLGGVRTLQLDADGGHVIAVGAGELIVIVVADPAAQLGLVRLEAQRAAEALA